jgi:hypothetical protein
MDVFGDFALSGGGDPAVSTAADHWTDLAAYTQSLRNVVARPGTYADLFPETTDDLLVQVLADGLAECHLEATLLGYEADDNALVRPPLASGQVALVVLYAGLRLLRSELLNRVTSAKYVAGPVSADTTYATNVLRDIMKALEQQKERVTLLLSTNTAATTFSMADSYAANNWGIGPNGVPLTSWLPLVAASW